MSQLSRTLGKQRVEVTCVQCTRTFVIPARVILERSGATCPHCHATYHSDGTAGREIDRAGRKLDRTLRRLQRKLR